MALEPDSLREIIFDTETTGFDPLNGDRMVEIGCIEMVGRVMTGNTFHAYFNPQRDMPSAAEQVHGLSTKFLSDKPLFGDKAAELLEFIGDSPLVAHNASFDFGFLNAELGLCGHPVVSMDRMVDTIALARVRHPGAKLSLDALCTRYGIDRSHRVKHGALLDAGLLAEVYIRMTRGQDSLVIDEVEAALKGLLKPEYEEVALGTAEIREVYRSSKFGNIAGVMVQDGEVKRGTKCRILRNGIATVNDLEISSLRRFKDDVTSVKEGYEAGINLGTFNDIEIGDIIETFEMKEIARS